MTLAAVQIVEASRHKAVRVSYAAYNVSDWRLAIRRERRFLGGGARCREGGKVDHEKSCDELHSAT